MITHAFIALTLLGLAFGTMIRPAVALGAIALMFVVEQYGQSGDNFYIQRSWLLNILFALIVVQGLVVKFFRSELRLSAFPRAGYVLICLFLFALLTAVWSFSPGHTKNVLWIQAPYLVLSILFAPLLVNSREDVSVALKTVAVVGFAFIVLILTTRQWGIRGLELAGSFYSRSASTSSTKSIEASSLELAGAAAKIAIIAVLMPLFQRFSLGVLLRWGIVIVCGLLIYKSQSRGQLLALVLILMVFVTWVKGLRSSDGFMMIGLLILGVIALGVIGLSDLGNRWTAESISEGVVDARLHRFQVILSTWFEAGPVYWLIGIGNSASWSPDILGIYPHNVLIEVLCEEGLIGFTLLAVFLYMVIRQGVVLTRSLGRNPQFAGQARVIPTVLALFAFDLMMANKQGSLATSYSLYFYALILMRLAMVTYWAPAAYFAGQQAAYPYQPSQPAYR